MRILMWFTMGFSAACGLFAYGMQRIWSLLPVGMAAVLAILVICLQKKKTYIRPAIAVLAGCASGLVWFGGYYLFYLQPVAVLDEQTVALTVTVSDYSYETDHGIGVDGMVSFGGKPYRMRIYLQGEDSLCPGDRVEGTFRIRFSAPDEKQVSSYFHGKGIFLTAVQRGESVTHRADTVPQWCFPAVLRQRILTMLDMLLPEDGAAFAKALLLGDGRDLDYGVETALKVSGIRHIIAVSGLHISILYGLICIITLRQRFLTAAVGIPVLLLFAAVAGFTPSVIRASVMVWLMMLSMVLDRSYDPPTALAFSVLVMLTVNPLAVTSVSLQLSVGCVSGILLFCEPINQWLKQKLPKGRSPKGRAFLCNSISVPLSAMSLVTPLTAYYFGTVSLVSILTNLLTLWVVNLIFNALVVICLLAWFLPGAAGLLAAAVIWPIRYVLWASKTMASFPLAAVYTKSVYIVLWLGFVYLLLLVFLAQKKKHPQAFLGCAALGLCTALLFSWAEPLTSDTRITMMDVGQGQSILLQSAGKTYLVDCGGDSDRNTADLVAETLLSQGIQRLDGLILTHYDRDHSGGLPNLLKRVDTDYLFLPDIRGEVPLFETDGKVVYLWEDMELTFGSNRLLIYGPVYSGYDNENSLCVLFDTEKCDILITGDRSAFGERMLLRRNALQDVDILVAGHHGAEESSSEELLQAVTPEIVLISVGENNGYGHPDAALLRRLKALGCIVYRTDRDGTICIRR